MFPPGLYPMVHYQTEEPKFCSPEICRELLCALLTAIRISNTTISWWPSHSWASHSPPVSPCCWKPGLAYHLSFLVSLSLKDIFITAFQKLPEVFMLFFVVLSRDTSVLEVPYEDQGLWTRGYSDLITEGVIHMVLLVRWHYTIMLPAPALILILIHNL